MLITFGERTVPSGLSAVLIASAPIFIAILAPFLDRSEIMSPLQWGGLVVGLGGVGLLVGVEQIGTPGEFLGRDGDDRRGRELRRVAASSSSASTPASRRS